MAAARLAALSRHVDAARGTGTERCAAPDLPDQGAPVKLAWASPKPTRRADAGFLSPAEDFGTVARGDPMPHTLPPDALAAAGLTQATWSVRVRADPFVHPPHARAPATMATPLTLDLAALRELGRAHGTVRVVKAMQCLNVNVPLGQGLWEGVPLATVLRACGRMTNVRRINYWGFHNNDPKQVFRSSVSYTEAMEPVPGDPPVFLAYALNGEPLPVSRGGPVRMIVPQAHGFKSVKWLQHIAVTNDYRASDTYASLNDSLNDPASHLKTYAHVDEERDAPPVPRGTAVVLRGVAMSGRTPLAHVEYWVRRVEPGFKSPRLADDADELRAAPWQRCELQPPPADWSAVLPAGAAAADVFGLSGEGARWPPPYCYVAWSATVTGLPAGDYELRARTVDVAGNAQPEPRPIQKSGKNAIGVRRVSVR